jgi:hypothetical protein
VLHFFASIVDDGGGGGGGEKPIKCFKNGKVLFKIYTREEHKVN